MFQETLDAGSEYELLDHTPTSGAFSGLWTGSGIGGAFVVPERACPTKLGCATLPDIFWLSQTPHGKSGRLREADSLLLLLEPMKAYLGSCALYSEDRPI